MVLRKFIVVSVMLLLASVQALAVNCDLRCNVMTIPAGSHSCGSHVATESKHMTMTHSRGMAMDSGNIAKSALSSGDCEPSICKAQLEAVVKNATRDELLSKPIAESTPPRLIRLFDEFSLIRSSLHRSPDRKDTSAPLELRPGSSLRI
jgi:hypothetical protein